MSDSKAGAKHTLEFLLRHHAVSQAKVVERYPAIVPLVARILGVVPRVFSYLEIWPPAFESYALVVPAFFELPQCDLGIGIGSSNRSLVAYAASRGHGCAYCAAHSAALGNVFRGAGENVERAASAISDGVCDLPEPKERALVNFGLAVGRGGAVSCRMEVEALSEFFSPRDVERVILVAATMGLLNRCLDTFGMVLEGSLLEMSRARLKTSGWEEEGVFSSEFDQQLLENEVAPPHLSPFGLVRAMAGAARFESAALGKFSGNLEQVSRQHLGFFPSYLGQLRSGRARKTILHLLVDRIIAPSGPLPAALCCRIAARFCAKNEDALLVQHFEFLAQRVSSASGEEGVAPDTIVSSECAEVCLAAAEQAAGAPVSLRVETVDQMGKLLSPQQIVQFVLTVSIASLLSRLVRALPEVTPEAALS